MRLRLLVACVFAFVFPLSAGAAPPLTVTFRAPGHTPKVNQRWPWSITATRGGKSVAGTVTAQVVDPVGGVHAVEFGASTTKYVTRVKFTGRFGDYVLYPPISRGIKVTFRVTVKTALGTRVFRYWVQAQ